MKSGKQDLRISGSKYTTISGLALRSLRQNKGKGHKGKKKRGRMAEVELGIAMAIVMCVGGGEGELIEATDRTLSAFGQVPAERLFGLSRRKITEPPTPISCKVPFHNALALNAAKKRSNIAKCIQKKRHSSHVYAE